MLSFETMYLGGPRTDPRLGEAPLCLCLAASLARKVYMKQGLGVGALRRQYGGRNKRKGVVPEHFCKASGGLIRHILIQLETLGFVEKHPGSHGGRRITSQVCARHPPLPRTARSSNLHPLLF